VSLPRPAPVTGSTVRGFYYARTTVPSQRSSTTVSRSDTIQFNLTFRLLGSRFGPERALSAGAVSHPTYHAPPPRAAQGASRPGRA
jgi:hypothetical protein